MSFSIFSDIFTNNASNSAKFYVKGVYNGLNMFLDYN